jgi:serine protease Do
VRTNPVLVAIPAFVFTTFASGAETEKPAENLRQTPIVKAVKKTRNAVVCIKAYKKGKESTGTGVVFDPRGFVLTNWHVIAGCERIVIHFADKTRAEGTVYKEIRTNDLAVLQVAVDKRFAYLEFGPGNDLMEGEPVIAVGHPLGYEYTVTTGIVSSLGREIEMPNGEHLVDLIQTSASINPGNSGGPLLNINGELIGINVAVRDGAQGIAFAINVETIKKVLSQQLSALKVSGLKHGLKCEDKSEPTGAHRQQVVVNAVAPDSPAAGAGLKSGDEVLQVAKVKVVNHFDVERAMWGHKAGDKVDVKVLRDGKELIVPLVLSGAGE